MELELAVFPLKTDRLLELFLDCLLASVGFFAGEGKKSQHLPTTITHGGSFPIPVAEGVLVKFKRQLIFTLRREFFQMLFDVLVSFFPM